MSVNWGWAKRSYNLVSENSTAGLLYPQGQQALKIHICQIYGSGEALRVLPDATGIVREIF